MNTEYVDRPFPPDDHCGDCMFIGSEGGRYCAALDGQQLRGDGMGPLRTVQCIELDLKLINGHDGR